MCIRDSPYVIYMDFESALYKLDRCAANPDKVFTINTHLHKPFMHLNMGSQYIWFQELTMNTLNQYVIELILRKN